MRNSRKFPSFLEEISHWGIEGVVDRRKNVYFVEFLPSLIASLDISTPFKHVQTRSMWRICTICQKNDIHFLIINQRWYFYRYPFNDLHHSSLFAKISRGYFTIPDHLSPKAKCLIRSLLRRDPSERLPASDILDHPWFTHRSKYYSSSHDNDQIVPDIDRLWMYLLVYLFMMYICSDIEACKMLFSL